MHRIILAFALLLALPASAATFYFTGNCTERYIRGDEGRQAIACEPFSAQINVPAEPEWFVPKAIHIFDSLIDATYDAYGLHVVLLESGAGFTEIDMGWGRFSVEADGSWHLQGEWNLHDLSRYYIGGDGGRFEVMQASVPVPATPALLAPALLMGFRRSTRRASGR